MMEENLFSGEAMEEVKVQQLREKKSKYDTMFRGSMVRFKVEGCSCPNAVLALFTTEKKRKDTVPSFISQMLPPEVANEPVNEVILREHLEIKWWEKMLGLTLQRKVERWAKKHIKEFKDIAASESNAEKLKGLIG